jgi:hypothetical protein
MESVPTGSKKLKEDHRAIVMKLFLDPQELFKDFTTADLSKLIDVVKNQINVYV